MTSEASDHSALIIQTLGLILGWVIVHWLSRQRDLQKERRGLIFDTAAAQIEKVNDVLIDGRSYHTTNRDEALERKIKMTLQDVAETISAVQGIVEDPAAIKRSLRTIRELRMAVTGKHFEDEHKSSLYDPDEVLESIALAGLNAKRALLLLQHSQYRHRPANL